MFKQFILILHCSTKIKYLVVNDDISELYFTVCFSKVKLKFLYIESFKLVWMFKVVQFLALNSIN